MNQPLVSDSQFLAQLEATTLPPAAFDHVGHVRAAWLCFRKDPSHAKPRFAAMLQRYAACLGQPQKYHVTVTQALLEIIEQRMNDGPMDEPWSAFAIRNRDLLDDAIGVLEQYYSRQRLFSEEARQSFLGPDRAPLPGAVAA
jgi:hypothetical protein